MPPTTNQAHPTQLADIEASWIETLLRKANPRSNPTVKNIDLQRIGEGVGFLGELGRINIEYADDDAGYPPSLIVKFSSPDASVRQFVAMFGLYRCEVNFYRHIAEDVPIRIPRCYFAEINEDGTQCALVFEDLGATGHVGDQVAGCTIEEARAAITNLAAFHGAMWNSPR